MSNEWGFGWDGDAARGAGESLDLEALAVVTQTVHNSISDVYLHYSGEVPEAATMPASLPPQKARHRRSNSTPLENTSSELLTAASDTR